MSKPFYCWQCKYFKPDNPATLRSGRCHRFAPHSLDYYGFSGISVDTPLTTKGDIYTFDTDDARLPVGSDGQVIFADSSEPKGIKWGDCPSGVSPLMSKGDLYTHNGASDARLPVGSDGQRLVTDSGEPLGIKWEDIPAANPLPFVASGSDDTETTFTTTDWTQKLRVTFTATTGVRYLIQWYFEMNAYQGQDIDGRVQINDTIDIAVVHFKATDYSTVWNGGDGGLYFSTALSGTVNVDIDYKNGYGANDKKIRRARIFITRVDDAVTAPLAMMAALKTLEEMAPDKLGAVIMAALPADVPAPTSAGKYSQIYDGGPGMWCGQFRPNTKEIPPLP
jgi:hypothetical protein